MFLVVDNLEQNKHMSLSQPVAIYHETVQSIWQPFIDRVNLIKYVNGLFWYDLFVYVITSGDIQ